jgi:succinate dehydrogenase / fumarate reductase cytochrome b subunit
VDKPASSFLARHEFLIRRLHSLLGLIPVGAFMCVHLVVNASVLEGVGTFQNNVYKIHGLGGLLPLVEWVFIFLPLIFHGVLGVVIIRGGLPNTANYPHAENIRYTLQRATGLIAFVFIFWHVFHMHGWIHADWWLDAIRRLREPFSGANFRPYNAASTAGEALQSVIVVILYAVGVLSCVFHLANGIWTAGITWGVWTSPGAQKRAWHICAVFGVLLAIVGMGALIGMRNVGTPDTYAESQGIENKLYEKRVELGEIKPDPDRHKRSHSETTDDVASRADQ